MTLRAGDHDAQGKLIREVNASHAGQPRPLVDAHLRQRFRECAITVDDAFVEDIVTRISSGTFDVARNSRQQRPE
jgi:hypothetical protein